jgi:protein TonB
MIIAALILFSTRHGASKITPRNAAPAAALSPAPPSAKVLNVTAPGLPGPTPRDQHGRSDVPARDKDSHSRTQQHSQPLAAQTSNAANAAGNSVPAPQSTVARLNLPPQTTGPAGEIPQPPALELPAGPPAVLQPEPGSKPEASIALATLPAPALSSAETSTAPTMSPAPNSPKYRVGGVVQAAKLLTHASPVYPAGARAERIQGTVRVIATVRKDGTVGEVKIAGGNPALTGAAVHAVRQWRFQPALLDGEPVQSETSIDIAFHLSN